jgi:hypothetical protein
MTRAADATTTIQYRPAKRWLLLTGIAYSMLPLALIIEPPISILFIAAVTALLSTCRSVQAFRYRAWNFPLAVAVSASWLFFYTASVGPAVFFDASLGNWTAPGLDAIELLYFPLLWLSELFLFEQQLNSYVELWEDYASGTTAPLASSTPSLLSLALVAALLTAVAFWRKMPEPAEILTFREQYRFRLKTLLLTIAVFSVVLGCASIIARWHMVQVREDTGQRALGMFGGTYSLRSAVDSQNSGRPPNWVSYTFFNYVAEVDLSVDAWPMAKARKRGRTLPPLTDEDLQLLSYFAHVRSLDLHGRDVGDDGMKHLKRLHHLRNLNIADTQVSDAGVRELTSALPECRILR